METNSSNRRMSQQTHNNLVAPKSTIISILPSINTTATLFWCILKQNPLGTFSYITLALIQEAVLMTLYTRLSQKQGGLDDKKIYEMGLGLSGANADSVIAVCIGICAVGAVLLLSIVYLYFKIKKTAVQGELQPTGIMTRLTRILSIFFGSFHELFGLAAQIYIALAFYWVNLVTSDAYNSTQQFTTASTGSLSNSQHLIILILLTVSQLELIFFSCLDTLLMKLQFKSSFSTHTRASEGLTDWLQPLNALIIVYLTLRPYPSQGERVVFMLVIIGMGVVRIISTVLVNPLLEGTLRQGEFYVQVISLGYFIANVLVFTIENSDYTMSTTSMVLIWITISFSVFGLLYTARLSLDTAILRKMIASHKLRSLLEEGSSSIFNSNGKSLHSDQGNIEYSVYMLAEMMDSDNPSTHLAFQKFMFEIDSVTSQAKDEVSYIVAMSKIMNEFRDSDDEDDEEVHLNAIGRNSVKSGYQTNMQRSIGNSKIERIDSMRSDLPRAQASNNAIILDNSTTNGANPSGKGDEYLGIVASIIQNISIKRRMSNAFSNMASIKSERPLSRMITERSRQGSIKNSAQALVTGLGGGISNLRSNNNADFDKQSAMSRDQDGLSIASKRNPTQYGDRLRPIDTLKPEKPAYIASSPPSQVPQSQQLLQPRRQLIQVVDQEHLSQFYQSNNNVPYGRNNNGAGDNGYQGCEPESLDHLLVDVFVNDIQKKKQNEGQATGLLRQRDRLKGDSNQFDNILRFLKMSSSSILSVKDIVKLIKVRFLYDQVARKCSLAYAKSIRLMFFKALFSIQRLQNKYLTLTTITHINLFSKRNLSYLQQVRTKISELYFVEQSMSSNNNSQSSNNSQTQSASSQADSLTKWTENDKELDLTQLMEQNLEVEKVRTKLRLCCEKIALFWQLYNSQHLGRQQFNDFLMLTSQITEMMNQIRVQAKQVQDMDSDYSKSDQLCYALSQFYSTVLRDQRQSSKIAQRMESYMIGGRGGMNGRTDSKMNIKFKENTIDDIGVVVVDGNFDLYGKIIFGNKQILRMLGYQAEDLLDRTVHMLMPRALADIHNQFWRAFSMAGEPKVLDQVRFLYMRDQQGYVFPSKIYIKFQCNSQFGYSFVGLMKKPDHLTISIEEDPVPLKETYHILCNKKGGILEISETVNDLLRLTPRIVSQLHDSLQEGFLLSIFSNELSFSELDFESTSSVFFKTILLDFTKCYQYLKNIESNTDSEDGAAAGGTSRANTHKAHDSMKKYQPSIVHSRVHGHGGNGGSTTPLNSIFVQMKITKEIYGMGSIAEPLHIYYVIFTEATEEQIATVTLQGRRNVGFESGLLMSQVHSGIGVMSRSGRLVADKRALDSGFNSHSVPDGDSESIYKTASISVSSSASSCSTTEAGITALDEDIEDQKTPRLLLGIRGAIKSLIVLLLIMSLVQFGVNVNFKSRISNDETILLESLQAQEYITELQILSRIYLNVNLGLEPANTTFVMDRRQEVKLIALYLIDKVRRNIQTLQTYLGKSSVSSSTIDRVRFYSLLGNGTVESRNLPRLYSVTLWLVQVEEIFLYQNMTSLLGTFLYQQQNKPQANITLFDQIAFFTQFNGQQELSTLFSSLTTDQQQLISDQVSQGIFINQLVSIGIALVILLSCIAMIYLTVSILQLKNKVLVFFEKLTPEQITLQEMSAIAFQKFIKTGNTSNLIISQQRFLEEFRNITQVAGGANQMGRLGNFVVGVDELNLNVGNRDGSGHAKGQPYQKSDDEDQQNEELKEEDSEQQIDEEEIQSPKGKGSSVKDKHDPKGPQAKIFKKLNADGIVSSKKKSKKGRRSQHRQRRSSNEHKKSTEKINIIPEVFIKQREVVRLMKERVKVTIMRTLPFMFILTSLLIIYYVMQYLLFEHQQVQIQEDSRALVDLIKSIECQEKLTMEIRNLQVSNNTRYIVDLNQKMQPFKIGQGPLLEELSVNQTFSDCLKQNQKVSNWLTNSGIYALDGKTEDSTICAKFESQRFTQGSNLTRADCEAIYKNSLQKTPLQSTSIFLQDQFYSAIRFMSALNRSDPAVLRAFISNTDLLESLDAHTFFQQFALRAYYEQIIIKVLDNQDTTTVITSLFAVFISILVVSGLVMHCLLSEKARRWFWNTFLLMQLLPRDDLDKEFIKNVNDFLRSA